MTHSEIIFRPTLGIPFPPLDIFSPHSYPPWVGLLATLATHVKEKSSLALDFQWEYKRVETWPSDLL